MRKHYKKIFIYVIMLMLFTESFCMVPGIDAEASGGLGKVKIKSVKSPSAGKASVKYSKVKGAKGYQIQFAVNSKMTKGRKKIKTKSLSKTVSLKPGKKYYVRVRAYKKSGKKIRYGKWSKKKSLKVKAKTKKKVSSKKYQELYGPIIRDVQESYSDLNEYCLYDIDKNGVKELLIQKDTAVAFWYYEIYTIKNNKCVSLGAIDGTYSAFYKDKSGGKKKYIIQVTGFRAEETVYHISIKKGKLKYKEISSRSLPEDGQYYSTPYPIKLKSVTDTSLLK